MVEVFMKIFPENTHEILPLIPENEGMALRKGFQTIL
jgi:hypothetical protein